MAGNGAGDALAQVDFVLASLERLGSQRVRDNLGPRYGIYTDKAFGVAMSAMQKLAKDVRRDTRKDVEAAGWNHLLAARLWTTGWYEARTVAALVDEPELVTAKQMDAWCGDFDNWAICDTVCFKLFDRVSRAQAFGKVKQWSTSRAEFVKRAAFALLASLALHDRETTNDVFARALPLIERAAGDERNFVMKGASWALRAIGRRSPALRASAMEVARRLAASDERPRRCLGKDVLRDLGKSPR